MGSRARTRVDPRRSSKFNVNAMYSRAVWAPAMYVCARARGKASCDRRGYGLVFFGMDVIYTIENAV